MANRIEDFFSGETLELLMELQLDGQLVDISGDAVTMYINQEKGTSTPAGTWAADVTMYGASSVARWLKTPAATALDPDTYWIEVVWTRSTGEVYVAHQQKVAIMQRVKV